MSIAADCYACAAGNHTRHDRDWNLRPGLIGGAFCDCPGDCAERSAAAFQEWWTGLKITPTPAADENGAGA